MSEAALQAPELDPIAAARMQLDSLHSRTERSSVDIVADLSRALQRLVHYCELPPPIDPGTVAWKNWGDNLHRFCLSRGVDQATGIGPTWILQTTVRVEGDALVMGTTTLQPILPVQPEVAAHVPG